jgi:hypothetical protein
MTLIARFAVDSFEPRQVTGLEADWYAGHGDRRLRRLDGVGPDRPR